MLSLNSLTHEEVLKHLNEDSQLEEARFRPSWLWAHFALELEACKERGDRSSHWYYTILQGYEASVKGEWEVINATIMCLTKIVEEEQKSKQKRI